jgi:alkylation response protein AidB-like acyl-CoA dehydrogenase
VDLALTQAQELSVASARAVVEREPYPHEPLVEHSRAVAPVLAAEIKREATVQGFHAANTPEDLGGGGRDPVSLASSEREPGHANFGLQHLVARTTIPLRDEPLPTIPRRQPTQRALARTTADHGRRPDGWRRRLGSYSASSCGPVLSF